MASAYVADADVALSVAADVGAGDVVGEEARAARVVHDGLLGVLEPVRDVGLWNETGVGSNTGSGYISFLSVVVLVRSPEKVPQPLMVALWPS